MTKQRINELIDYGVEQKRTGNYEQAIEYYNRAKDLNPDNIEVYNALGKVQYIIKNYESAVTSFLIAATYSADHLNLNQLYHSTNNSLNPFTSNTEAQLNSLMLNFGRHIGYSFIAKNKKTQEVVDNRLIDEALNYYRTLIDPYYRDLPTTPQYVNDKEVERTIISLGMFYMRDLSKQVDFGLSLNKASEYYIRKNFNV